MNNTIKYWAKYAALWKANTEFGFLIPETIPLSADETKEILQRRMPLYESIPEWDNWYMIRSSSPLESDEDGGKLSGVYKSVYMRNREDIYWWMQQIIEYNQKEFIEKIHEKVGFSTHPFIPLLIQPYLEWKFAWVISRYSEHIYIDVQSKNNHSITSWVSKSYLSYHWEVSEDGRLITHIISRDFILQGLITAIQKILDTYIDTDWSVEFTYTDMGFILLQIKEFRNKTILLPISQYDTEIMSYEILFEAIAKIMKQMGYREDEFFVQQDDHITAYMYLWVTRHTWESLEHIRIWVYHLKFQSEPVREWVVGTVFPKDNYFKDLWLTFFGIHKVGVIFNILSSVDNIIHTKYTYTNATAQEKVIQMYDCSSGHGFDTHEKYFFLQSIRVRNLSHIENTIKVYTKLYRYMSFICEIGIVDWVFFKEKRMFLQKNLVKYIWILKACQTTWLISDDKIVGKYIRNNTEDDHEYRVYSIQELSRIKSYQKERFVGIAYVCHDFEPVFIPYIHMIDLIIISRSSINSHAVCIAKEYKKNILFQTRNIDLIKTWDTIVFNHHKNSTEVNII